jgi:hypothetical protein
LTPESPTEEERGPERDADESEAPTTEPDPAPESDPSKAEPDDQRYRGDKPGADEYDEERLPPEPTDPSEGG